MLELGEDLQRSRGNDMDRVPGAVHGQLFSGHCSSCEGSRVPKAEAEDDDSDGVCGLIHGGSPFC